MSGGIRGGNRQGPGGDGVYDAFAEDIADLGQDLCHPPTVKGWTGGRVLDQHRHGRGPSQSRRLLLQGGEPYGDKLDPWAVAQKHGYATPESGARFLLDLFVQGDIEPDIREALLNARNERGCAGKPRATVRLCGDYLPEYQLA